jgi:Immunity protein 30
VNRSKAAKMLYESRLMRNAEQVKQFEKARLALFSTRNPSVLSDLFAAFDDSSDQHDVMWGLVHDAEAFDRDVYLRAMSMALSKMLKKAKGWAFVLNERILNSAEFSLSYHKIILELPAPARRTVIGLLKELGDAKPKFASKVRKLLD